MYEQARPLQKGRTVNATDASFPSKVVTATEPAADNATATGSAAISLTTTGGGGLVPSRVRFRFYGVGADNTTFEARLIGWFRGGIAADGSIIWLPEILAAFTCTLGTAAGVGSGGFVKSTESFVDTITIGNTAPTVGEPSMTADVTRSGDVLLYSPANNLIAWADVDLQGCEKFEFTYDMVTATSANALYTLKA